MHSRLHRFRPDLTITSAVLAIAAFAIAGYFISKWMEGPALPPADKPTNFVRSGILIFPVKETGQDTPYLMYTNPGGVTTTVELSIDPSSVCARRSGSTPCVAMSVQYHIPFGGKRAIVEAVEENAKITVKKIRILDPEETADAPRPGIIYIPWQGAVALINQCGVSMVMEAHDGNVYLTPKYGGKVASVEPVAGELTRVLNEAQNACGEIPRAIE